MTKRRTSEMVMGNRTFSHGETRRRRPEELEAWLNRPPRVLMAFSVGDHPSHQMLMVSQGALVSSVYLDGADIDSWLTEHHPEVGTTDADGKLVFDVLGIAGEILAPCLKHACAQWAQKIGQKLPPQHLQGYEVGHLLDPDHSYLNYARRLGVA